MPEPWLHLVLVHPEIGPNTGNVGRLSVGLCARLHLVHPLGFQIDEKAVRRAGIDHWKQVDLVEHADLEQFRRWTQGRRVHRFSAGAARALGAAHFEPGDVLVFGPESVGLPASLEDLGEAWRIPLWGPVRSLNLSNAVAVAAFSALRQLDPGRFEGTAMRGGLDGQEG